MSNFNVCLLLMSMKMLCYMNMNDSACTARNLLVPDSRIGFILTFAYLEPCKWSIFHFY